MEEATDSRIQGIVAKALSEKMSIEERHVYAAVANALATVALTHELTRIRQLMPGPKRRAE
jgi:hypothetical protein